MKTKIFLFIYYKIKIEEILFILNRNDNIYFLFVLFYFYLIKIINKII